MEQALSDRGWGGGVLYGFGEDVDDEDDLEDDDLDDDLDDELDSNGDLELDGEDDGPFVAPPGRRMTVQSRHDLVVVDEEALLRHVERRVREAGGTMDREAIEEHDPLFVLAFHVGFGGMDLEGTGLVFAGGQDTVHPVPLTLWEMDDDDRDDAFPTAHP